MAEIRIAGTIDSDSAANEGVLREALQKLSEPCIAICGWSCPRGRTRDPLQIDALVVCRRGVFILEAKNWRGSIIGDTNEWEWQAVGGTKRVKSPIESTFQRAHAVRDYLRNRLSETRSLFDEKYERLRIWVGCFVILLNRNADVRGVKDDRVSSNVGTLSTLNDNLFLSARRQPWAPDLSEDEIFTVADAIFRPMAAPIVGVDFGTTNSAVAYFTPQEQTEIFSVAEERVLLPSLFAFEGGKKQVGLEVENSLQELDLARLSGGDSSIDPRNVVFWIKKLLGRTYQEYKDSKEEYPYVVGKKQRDPDALVVRLSNKAFTPDEIATEILRSLYQLAESRLGERLEAVIPVPVRFTDRQRRALEAAAKEAGFKEVHLAIDEATAAALYLAHAKDYNGTVAVYDLGGGTFDVSIVEVRNGVTNVKAIRGDAKLGGYHFDLALADYLLNKKFRGGLAALQVDDLYTVRRELERARKRLSNAENAMLRLKNPRTNRFETMELSRTVLEDATKQIVGRTLDLCQEAVAAAKLNGVERIDDVLMSGGVTFMPLVRNRVRELFFSTRPEKQLIFPANPSVLVTNGAAIYAGMLMGRIPYTRVGERVAPFSYGIRTYIDYPKDQNVYMSVLIGRDDKLFDSNGRPQTFPARNYLTIADQQTSIRCNLLQANMAKTERRLADQCTTIGSFQVDIEPLAAGENGLSVAFAIDKNGILEIDYQEVKRPENRGKKRFNMLLHAREKPAVRSGAAA